MANAADVTFKDVVREACLSRDHFLRWTETAGSVAAAVREMCAALGVADCLDPLTETIAKIIIERAKRGELDPVRLCEVVLEELRS